MLWIVALGVFGRWGRRLSDSQRAFLAALIGVGVVHLVIFPASGQPLAAVMAKALVVFCALLNLGIQTSDQEGSTKPFAKWNRRVAAGVAVSAAVGVGFACRILPMHSAVTAALLILAPVAYVLIFGAATGLFQRPSEQRFLVRLWLVVPLIIAGLSATQSLLLAITNQRAEQSLQRGDPRSALDWNAASLSVGERLRIPSVNDRLLLRQVRILDALDRPADALRVMLRRCRLQYPSPDDPQTRLLNETYLSTSPLQAQIDNVIDPSHLRRLDQLPLPKRLGERSLLLGLFARAGSLDRLQIEYAQHGLREGLDYGYLRRGLDSPSLQKGQSEIWADYFRGICDARLGQRDAAAKDFRRVLARWPGYHNALVWLDRLGATASPPKKSKPTSAPLDRIENAQMLGDHRWGLNVDDVLWTALEVRPGRYLLRFEVCGVAAEGEWPILTVYLDGALVLEQPVKTQEWSTANWEAQFDRDACHRLVVGFSNDILKTVGGRTINRNLYLSQVQIEQIGRDKAGADK
jgi:hypothetical protein